MVKKENRRYAILRLIILAFAVILIIYGAVSGEPESLFRKAANICLECIGIG